MKTKISCASSIIFTLLFSFGSVSLSAPDLSKIPKFAPDRVLVGFKPGTPDAEKRALHTQMRAKVEKTLDAIGVEVVSVPMGSVEVKVETYKKNPNVKFAEPDYYRSFVVPHEGHDMLIGDYFTQQWPLLNTGQALIDPDSINNLYTCYLLAPLFGWDCSSPPFHPLTTYTGVSGADINALTPSGAISNGNSSVSIAILDSGIDCTNKDFEVASSTKCFDNRIFNDVSLDTTDELPHGTLVASVAAANAGDSAGIAGVAQGPMIANLKVCYPYDTTGLGDYVGLCPVSASAAAILYAANLSPPPPDGYGKNILNHPYEVINMSYGSDCPPDPTAPALPPSSGPTSTCAVASNTENSAIQSAWTAGSVIVAAAGNDYGTSLHYPAAYNNVIAVASSDYNDNLSSFSTYGNSWVDLIAPGTNIISSAPDVFCEATCSAVPSFPGCPFNHNDGCVGYASGTSLSSPHVAGVAAMVWSSLLSTNPSTTNGNVRDCILNNADLTGASGQNFGAWTIHGKVNLQEAMVCSLPTLHVSGLTAAGSTAGGNKWKATVKIYVKDQSNALKGGATVTGLWSVGGTSSCITGQKGSSLGSCSVSKTYLNSIPSVTFTVTGASLSGYSYDSSLNAPNSTVIIVSKP